ncbi:NAD-dependent epimerase/dehydratase family protein [Novacetimonas pomaceti]|uniref:NAD-dependent epimerase/dehydratase family protein n=1 Tax=Novacetimonas pomaceti TaxID=2021998 RepID=UPI001C2DCDD1|nr:NAD-dependent epimerase/dehydratase family protein [Novacetimonas pomaceti]MBV1833562.1 GDP-mannose 4,6-dehydratase [Novacetimonas pomaceti]
MRVLVTGSAGFIGFHLARRLLDEGHEVVGIDGMTSYYDVALKRRRHMILRNHPRFVAHEIMLEDRAALDRVMEGARFDVIIHLAAQAGVRYGMHRPDTYIDSNIVGTANLIEAARGMMPDHFLLASTSSVYGASTDLPFVEAQCSDYPISLYAATKKATEVLAHSFSHLSGTPVTALRFFTVYGTWGRPDMALFLFVDAILRGRNIEVYGNGQMERDFTYIDDVVESVTRLLSCPPVAGDRAMGASPAAPYRVVNVGNGQPVPLMDFVHEIETCLGRRACVDFLPMQPGDMTRTWADTSLLERLTGFRPATPLSVGVRHFVEWYQNYYARHPA